MAVKYIFENPFYVKLKKHYCPKCNKVLTVRKIDKVVNSMSGEAKSFDFDNGENSMRGDVKFIWNVFYCSDCNKEITIKDMKKYELSKKRGNKR